MPPDVNTSPVDIRAVDGAVEGAAERGVSADLIDLTPVPALQAKVIGLIAMGGSDDHFLGAERHLRDVLAFYGAVVKPVAVYLNGGDFAESVPGERAETRLDQLFTVVTTTSAALEQVEAIGEPLPLDAKAVRPTSHRR